LQDEEEDFDLVDLSVDLVSCKEVAVDQCLFDREFTRLRDRGGLYWFGLGILALWKIKGTLIMFLI
jgi:hypothetical protein